MNIKDAYKHPKFFKDIDKTTGFHTRSATNGSSDDCTAGFNCEKRLVI